MQGTTGLCKTYMRLNAYMGIYDICGRPLQQGGADFIFLSPGAEYLSYATELDTV